MKVLMGTKNPGKIEGAKQAFEEYFDGIEIEGIAVDSDVSNQPFNDEIFKGATNRVKNLKNYAKSNNIEADFYIASEAGIIDLSGEFVSINSAYIEDKAGLKSLGISQGFPVPEKYIEEIKEKELSSVMDKLFEGNRLSDGKGGINFLTKGKVSRIELTKNAFIMALTKYINEEK